MLTGRRTVPSGWATAVVQILGDAQLRPADLARRGGYSPAAISRYLSSRDRVPSAETILDLNEAMAQLLSTTHVRDYLTSVAIIEGLVGDDNGVSNHGAYGALNSVQRYFADNEMRDLYSALWNLPSDRRRSIVRELNAIHFKSLVRHIVYGRPNSIFDQIQQCFRRFGFDLSPYLADENQLARVIAAESFLVSVRHVLIQHINDAASRLDAELWINSAFWKASMTTMRRQYATEKRDRDHFRMLGRQELGLEVLGLIRDGHDGPALGREVKKLLCQSGVTAEL